MNTVEQRLERLERSNRRWRGLVVALLTGAVALTLTCANIPDAGIVTAEEIQVVDAEGNIRIRLGADEDGRWGLRLFDTAGTLRGDLVTVADGGVGLNLYDARESVRAAISMANDAPGLVFLDPASVPRITLGANAEGAHLLALYDDNREPRAILALMPDLPAIFQLFDTAGTQTFLAP